jgi:hypothetical protein
MRGRPCMPLNGVPAASPHIPVPHSPTQRHPALTHPKPHNAAHHTPTHQNEVKASVADFDRALALSPQLRPFLWQRGLSLYYLGQFQEAAQQFRCVCACVRVCWVCLRVCATGQSGKWRLEELR